MIDTPQEEKDMDPGVNFTELFPSTYLVVFESFEENDAHNTYQANYYLNKCKGLLEKHPDGNFNLVIDTTLIGDKVSHISSSAKKLYKEAIALPGSGKVALVGFGSWLRRFISFLIPFSAHLSQTSFFETREQAIEWIKDDTKE